MVEGRGGAGRGWWGGDCYFSVIANIKVLPLFSAVLLPSPHPPLHPSSTGGRPLQRIPALALSRCKEDVKTESEVSDGVNHGQGSRSAPPSVRLSWRRVPEPGLKRS